MLRAPSFELESLPPAAPLIDQYQYSTSSSTPVKENTERSTVHVIRNVSYSVRIRLFILRDTVDSNPVSTSLCDTVLVLGVQVPGMLVAIRFHQNDVIIWYSTYVTVVLEYCFTLRST